MPLQREREREAKKYQIIYADPPWSYKDEGCQGAAAAQYQTMTTKDICLLPIQDLADKNCVLFMWATYPKLQEALNVIKAWGFEYKTIAFQWVKTYKSGFGEFLGLGRWTRGNTEPCLLATKGHPRRINAGISQLIFSPLRRHSQKPPEARVKIKKLLGDLPAVELFAREKTPGWDVWGNEVESDIVIKEAVNDGSTFEKQR